MQPAAASRQGSPLNSTELNPIPKMRHTSMAAMVASRPRSDLDDQAAKQEAPEVVRVSMKKKQIPH